MTLTSTQLFKLAGSTAASEIAASTQAMATKLNQAAQEFPALAHEIVRDVQTEATQGLKIVRDWTRPAVEWIKAHEKGICAALLLAGMIALLVGGGLMLTAAATGKLLVSTKIWTTVPLTTTQISTEFLVGTCLAVFGIFTIEGAGLRWPQNKCDDSSLKISIRHAGRTYRGTIPKTN